MHGLLGCVAFIIAIATHGLWGLCFLWLDLETGSSTAHLTHSAPAKTGFRKQVWVLCLPAYVLQNVVLFPPFCTGWLVLGPIRGKVAKFVVVIGHSCPQRSPHHHRLAI